MSVPNDTGDANAGKPDQVKERRLPAQDKVAIFYTSVGVQVGVACLIGANFLTNIVEKEIDPRGDKYKEIFEGLGTFYTLIFTVELFVNMYAHWLCEFWHSSWNIFDVTVVVIGLVNLINLPLPPETNLLRMMRAFRIFRLFGKVKSLKKIVGAIMRSIPGVTNAFLILTIFMCIFAILAVELFKDVGEGCDYEHRSLNLPKEDRRGFDTKRKFCMGQEYFGDFAKSFYTFFQCLTGESWSENVARPVIWYFEDPLASTLVAVYFVIFFIITTIVLTNVVLALLTDKLMSPDPDDEAEAAAQAALEAEAEATRKALNPEWNARETKVAKELGKLQGSLAKLGSNSAGLQDDFDSAKSEMAEISEQIALVVKAMERKFRIAEL